MLWWSILVIRLLNWVLQLILAPRLFTQTIYPVYWVSLPISPGNSLTLSDNLHCLITYSSHLATLFTLYGNLAAYSPCLATFLSNTLSDNIFTLSGNLTTNLPCLANYLPCLTTYLACLATCLPCLATYLPCLTTYLACLATYLPCLATYLPCLATYSPCLATYSCNLFTQLIYLLGILLQLLCSFCVFVYDWVETCQQQSLKQCLSLQHTVTPGNSCKCFNCFQMETIKVVFLAVSLGAALYLQLESLFPR